MNRFLKLSVILGATSFGLVGCGEESKVEDKTTVETPGGTTEVTKETSVEKSGPDAPAVPPAEAPAPAEPPK